ncbi:GNAT family N-acetyltransferase [Streptomyces spinosisporus]|uniref:GNAT family N-acetyltransferase n=1 Tax=Streptomyces spinosisporus TaxID=2927582 RepID=A0ABS9XU71_9ACTN|nr:GNAT family N-acetyltransferase [Streptomyces spinosisporus]MCI3245638.1 GNAT family N-acetyltransferase [Streptomyces spinosisporus]
MAVRITPATVTDIRQVLSDHARYWGERDLRHLHLLALVQEFGETCLVARAADDGGHEGEGGGVLGYLIGFVTPDRTGYVHLVATRDDARGTGLGRELYAAFTEAARRQGAVRLKAITSTGNTGSVAFHRSLGFEVRTEEDYNGPGETRVVFRRALS